MLVRSAFATISLEIASRSASKEVIDAFGGAAAVRRHASTRTAMPSGGARRGDRGAMRTVPARASSFLFWGGNRLSAAPGRRASDNALTTSLYLILSFPHDR